MTLACVVALCQTYGISYDIKGGSISFDMYGQYKAVRYPVLVSNAGKPEVMQAFLWFPAPQTHTIAEVERLCSQLNEVFNPYAQVGFEAARGKFWAGTLFTDHDAEQKLGVFAQSCDILLPLLTRIGCLGRWDGELIQLACMDPQDFAGGRH